MKTEELCSALFRQPERRVEISTLRICIAKIRGGQFVTSSAFANSRVARVIRDGFSGFSSRTDWINVSLSRGAETRDSLELRGGWCYVWLPAPAGEREIHRFLSSGRRNEELIHNRAS